MSNGTQSGIPCCRCQSTSLNVGIQLIQKLATEHASEEEIQDSMKDALRARFLPEFLNRIDDTIVFHPLQPAQIYRIVELQLEHLRKQLGQQQIELELTPAAVKQIADEGYDPAFGARPLKRIIQCEVQNPLATELLKGSIGYPSLTIESSCNSNFDSANYSRRITLNRPTAHCCRRNFRSRHPGLATS